MSVSSASTPSSPSCTSCATDLPGEPRAASSRWSQSLNDEEHVAILLVEQNALLAFDLCERAYVLETGRMVLEGASAEIRDRPEVHSAYLGDGPG